MQKSRGNKTRDTLLTRITSSSFEIKRRMSRDSKSLLDSICEKGLQKDRHRDSSYSVSKKLKSLDTNLSILQNKSSVNRSFHHPHLFSHAEETSIPVEILEAESIKKPPTAPAYALLIQRSFFLYERQEKPKEARKEPVSIR